MPEYGFCKTHISPFKYKILEYVLIQKNTGQRILVFWHILRSVFDLRYATSINFQASKYTNSQTDTNNRQENIYYSKLILFQSCYCLRWNIS